jgi:hypothetical protein
MSTCLETGSESALIHGQFKYKDTKEAVSVGDFTIEDFEDFKDPDYTDLWPGLEWTTNKFGWWCLGHNFDVVATIITMSALSWQEGFESGRNLAFFDEHDGWTPNTDPTYLIPLLLGKNPTD